MNALSKYPEDETARDIYTLWSQNYPGEEKLGKEKMDIIGRAYFQHIAGFMNKDIKDFEEAKELKDRINFFSDLDKFKEQILFAKVNLHGFWSDISRKVPELCPPTSTDWLINYGGLYSVERMLYQISGTQTQSASDPSQMNLVSIITSD